MTVDEVRVLGSIMGIDEDLVWRHPFPGPGIAIRILGEGGRMSVVDECASDA